jgi:hypothetical protein
MSQRASDKRPKLKKTAVRFGTWKVRSLYRAGSLMTVAKDISKYKLDLTGVKEAHSRDIDNEKDALL